jgi:hypothetical protein
MWSARSGLDLGLLVVSSIVVSGAARTYVVAQEETCGPLTVNFHNFAPPTTQLRFSGLDAGQEEWIAVTPWGVLLEPHNASLPIEEWHADSWNGYPSSNGGNSKVSMVTTSNTAGIQSGIDAMTGERPPASELNIGFTSYSVKEATSIEENGFFIQSPNYLRYLIPACPNFVPGSDLAGSCPARDLAQGEWKFSVLGMLHGTNVNSLRPGNTAPHQLYGDEQAVVRDIAGYKTLIYRMILDIGGMGSNAKLEVVPRIPGEKPPVVNCTWVNESDGNSTPGWECGEALQGVSLDSITPGTNLVDTMLQVTGTASPPLLISFIEHYGTGTFTRDLSEVVCNTTHHSDGTPRLTGNIFGECTRDVTGFDASYAGNSNPNGVPFSSYTPGGHGFPTAARGSSGAPVLSISEIKEMKITVQPASCSGRPSEGPWTDAPADCPWWYKVMGHPQPQFGVSSEKDRYTRCEAGTCFHVDFHFDLGGETLGSRTVLGDPENDAAYGMEKGTFFVYDPKVSADQGQGTDLINAAAGVSPLLATALLLAAAAATSVGQHPR